MAIAEPTEPITTPTISTTRLVPSSFEVSSANSLCYGYVVRKAVTARIATAEPSRP